MIHSKYHPLFQYLYDSGQDEVTLSFAAIEEIMGTTLPGSARQNRSWWSNRAKGGLQAGAWLRAGYNVTELDLATEQVTLRKAELVYNVKYVDERGLWNAGLIKALRMYMGFTQAQLAEELGVRQQTISEWEVEMYPPGRSSSKHLSRVAEQFGFKYKAED